MQNEFRSRFPSLKERVHLASCSYAPYSTMVNDALADLLREVERPDAPPWDAVEGKVSELRASVADLLGCEARQVGLMPNASIGAYQVANSMDWGKRRRIVSCRSEFPSISQVWHAQTLRGAEWVVIDAGTRPDEILQAYREALDDRVALVSIPAVDYVSGARFPVAQVAALARELGVQVFCDAYQSVGTAPVDVDDLGVDFLVAGAMKYLLAWPGVAFLYARRPESVQRISELTGWQGRPDPFNFDPHDLGFPDTARRFETGTPAFITIYAAVAGIRATLEVGAARIADHVAALKQYALRAFDGHGLSPAFLFPPSLTAGHFSFRADNADEVARHLLRNHVHVSPRLGVIRVALHAFNEPEDIDGLCASLVSARDAGIFHCPELLSV